MIKMTYRTLNFKYPWQTQDSNRAAIYREVIRLGDLKQKAAKSCNFRFMKKIEVRIKELRRQLGYKAWGKG